MRMVQHEQIITLSAKKPIRTALQSHIMLVVMCNFHPRKRSEIIGLKRLSMLLEEPSLATTLQGVYFIFYIFCRYTFRPLVAIFRRKKASKGGKIYKINTSKSCC
jgi:hypothetical protein